MQWYTKARWASGPYQRVQRLKLPGLSWLEEDVTALRAQVSKKPAARLPYLALKRDKHLRCVAAR